MPKLTGLLEKLSAERGAMPELSEEPTKAEIHEVVQELKQEGLCGRRIGEQQLGPYFLSSNVYGQREIDLLEEILAEEYEGTDLCLQTRQSDCSRLRGGCKGRH